MNSWQHTRGNPGNSGATLLEVVVASAMAAVTLLGVYSVIISSGRSFGLMEATLDVQQSVRMVADRIADETRWADEVMADNRCRPSLLCSDRLILHIPSANPLRAGADYLVEFRFDSASGALIRRQGHEEGVLADGFREVIIHFLTAEGQAAERPEDVARIDLSITAMRTQGRVVRRSLETAIALRNLRRAAGATAFSPPDEEAPRHPSPHPPLQVQAALPEAPPSLPALSARPASSEVERAIKIRLPAVKSPASPGRVLYVVQVIVVGTREAAEDARTRLLRAGLDPYVVPTGPGYAVRLGAFRVRANADRVRAEAKARGVPTSMLTVTR